jgi:hypothetical protein
MPAHGPHVPARCTNGAGRPAHTTDTARGRRLVHAHDPVQRHVDRPGRSDRPAARRRGTPRARGGRSSGPADRPRAAFPPRTLIGGTGQAALTPAPPSLSTWAASRWGSDLPGGMGAPGGPGPHPTVTPPGRHVLGRDPVALAGRGGGGAPTRAGPDAAATPRCGGRGLPGAKPRRSGGGRLGAADRPRERPVAGSRPTSVASCLGPEELGAVRVLVERRPTGLVGVAPARFRFPTASEHERPGG